MAQQHLDNFGLVKQRIFDVSLVENAWKTPVGEVHSDPTGPTCFSRKDVLRCIDSYARAVTCYQDVYQHLK